MKKKTTTEEFIKRATIKHNGKYDYSKAIYITHKDKVCIICPEHGEFWQLPGNHMQKSGCPACGKNSMINSKRDTLESFIEKAIHKHGTRYDYSKVKYVDSRTKVTIVCSTHGDFEQLPADHVRGYNCIKCQVFNNFSSTLSKRELLIQSWLEENNIKFKHNFELITPEIARNSYCIIVDFFVKFNDKQYFIEYDGKQHFRFTKHFYKTFEEFRKQQRRDRVLNNFCELHKDKVTLIRFNYKQTDGEILQKLEKIFSE